MPSGVFLASDGRPFLLGGKGPRIVPITLPTITPPSPGTTALGYYVGNPNAFSSEEEQRFQDNTARFTTLMGKAPTHANAFVNFGATPGQAWIDDAGSMAYSWVVSPASTGGAQFPFTKLVPVVGIPMSVNWKYYALNREFFQETIDGMYDTMWTGIANKWFEYTSLVWFRPGYEFDGGFMPWYMGGGSGEVVTADLFKRAFQRISTVLKNAAATYSGPNASAGPRTAKITWNPAQISYTDIDVDLTWPGDSYVDSIGIDAYSPCYELDLYDWELNDGSTYAPDDATWKIKAANRRHFWTYPSGRREAPTGQTGVGYGVRRGWQFALAHGKTICLPEVGSVQDAEFPAWLAQEVALAAAAGVPCEFVNIWATTQGDGDWDFLYPPGSSDTAKIATANAWRAGFGA